MKKRFFLGLAALAALALTSCQKDLVVNQVPDETPIGFSTYLGRDAVTKGSAITTDNIENFGVFAYYMDANTTWPTSAIVSPNVAPALNFMNNQFKFFQLKFINNLITI